MPLSLKGIRRRRILSVLFLLILFSNGFPGKLRAGEVSPFLDFIYVNANTGEAAGGHSAIKLGSTVFHYQFFPGGLFLLTRDSWSNFKYIYNELSNRSVARASLCLTPPVFSRLKAHFTDLLIAQEQDLLQLQEARSDLRFARQLCTHPDEVELESVGLFDGLSVQNPGMLEIRDELARELGAGMLRNRIMLLRKQISGLLSGLAGKKMISVSELRELFLEQHFFSLVLQGASLAEDAVFVLPESKKLSLEERKKLSAYRHHLLKSIVHLCRSNRQDRAEDLLLQAARYLVVTRSIAERRICTLDPFSRLAVARLPEQKEAVEAEFFKLQQGGRLARSAFFLSVSHKDVAYAWLETILGRLYEVKNGVVHGTQVKTEPGILLPSRSGRIRVSWLPPSRKGLDLSAIERRVEDLNADVESKRGYDLFRRNCATELLRNVNSAFSDAGTGRDNLGGWLVPDHGFVFIPAVMQNLITQKFPVVQREVLLSHRLQKMEKLFEQENDMVVWLRESNVFSSTLYVSRLQDSAFLFFTDNALLMRPVLGVANMIWAAVYGVGGFLTLPEDGGERIWQGARGVFYSMPELFFGNIRKGTYDLAGLRFVAP